MHALGELAGATTVSRGGDWTACVGRRRGAGELVAADKALGWRWRRGLRLGVSTALEGVESLLDQSAARHLVCSEIAARC